MALSGRHGNDDDVLDSRGIRRGRQVRPGIQRHPSVVAIAAMGFMSRGTLHRYLVLSPQDAFRG